MGPAMARLAQQDEAGHSDEFLCLITAGEDLVWSVCVCTHLSVTQAPTMHCSGFSLLT